MDDTLLFCPNCGCEQTVRRENFYNERPLWQVAEDNRPHPWITVLSFIFVPLAVIWFFWWRYTDSSKSWAAAKGGFLWLAFFYPIVGIILYVSFKDSHRELSRKCGIFCIVGFVFKLLFVCAVLILHYEFGITIEMVEEFESAMAFIRL